MFPTSRLDTGDRFYLGPDTQVEVVEAINRDPRSPWEGTVRSVTTGRVRKHTIRLREPRSRVDLLVDRGRLDCLTLPFWSGGVGWIQDEPQAYWRPHAQPLDVPLTVDGQAFLRANFSPPGSSRDGVATQGWSLDRLTVMVPSACADGGLATMIGRSHRLLAPQEWDLAIQRLNVVDALSDGGLSAAGRELVNQLSQNAVVDEDRAWVRAVAAYLGLPVTRQLEDAFLFLAPRWKTSVAELFDVANAVSRPAAGD